MTERSRAFVPGHVTGFFSTHHREDPRRAGSRGAGLALSDGVTVTVEPASTTTVTVNGEAGRMAAVEHVLSALDLSARVECVTPLPVSAGFGVSGASALGTALAADALPDDASRADDALADDALPGTTARTENELVAIAHAAEVRAGTGLGDVVGQARGGVPTRLEPGAPPHGELDGLPARPTVEYVTFGELDTAEIIGGDTDRLSAAGESALDTLVADPTLDTFMRACRRFARDADLLTDPVATAIDDVRDAGGEAAMAMLGETVFALGSGLTDAGYDARSCRVTGGASLVE